MPTWNGSRHIALLFNYSFPAFDANTNIWAVSLVEPDLASEPFPSIRSRVDVVLGLIMDRNLPVGTVSGLWHPSRSAVIETGAQFDVLRYLKLQGGLDELMYIYSCLALSI
jgi:hypothetical protein